MPTGYEVKFYADVSRATRALERIAVALERIAVEPSTKEKKEAGDEDE